MAWTFDSGTQAWRLVGAILTWIVCAGLLVYEATTRTPNGEIIALAGSGMFVACYLVSADKIRKP